MASIMAVPNENISSTSRITKDGRSLFYQMTVVQQPERARACGAGAKSSADRRPVDPPPIVELRIFDGAIEDKKDITFSHTANFFLYTTLEHARPINQGRVPVSAATLPVLTGTPVAGMAYLDRPKPAGYFIFPDLSVRHEGKYRLSFNLYEELKVPEKDADAGSPEQSPTTMENASIKSTGCKNFVHFRLEVKSGPFSVFSAKKFPGLSESTQLSRQVNEQGCRVRIRRDVRMRRRDKVSDGYNDTPDDNGYHQPDRFTTPQQPPDRPRSVSNPSVEIPTSYNVERRPSVHSIGYYQAGYQQPPPPPQSATSYTSHLSFGGPSTPHYQTPTMPAHPQYPLPPYPQPAHAYAYGPPNHARQMSAPHNYGYPCQPPQQATYGPPSYMDERPYQDNRRSSGGMLSARQQPPIDTYVHSHPGVQAHPTAPQMRSLTPLNTNLLNQGPPSLPPIKSLVQTTDMESPSSEPKSAISGLPQGPHNPYSASGYMTAPYSSAYGISPSSQTPSSTQGKRVYRSAFDSSHMDQPMHSGRRPSESLAAQDFRQLETQDGELVEATGEYDDISAPISYKRADGSFQHKKCPSPREQRDTSRYVLNRR